MKPITKNGTFPALLALGLLLMDLAGCSAATGNPNAAQENSEDKPSSPYTGNLVGKVEGTNAFVAVVVDRENHALAYICDGNEIAEWFRGAVAQDGSLDGVHLPPAVAHEPQPILLPRSLLRCERGPPAPNERGEGTTNRTRV